MKIQITTQFDTETGEYELTFNNLSSPGEPLDLRDVQEAMSLVTKDFLIRIDKEEELPEGFEYEQPN